MMMSRAASARAPNFSRGAHLAQRRRISGRYSPVVASPSPDGHNCSLLLRGVLSIRRCGCVVLGGATCGPCRSSQFSSHACVHTEWDLSSSRQYSMSTKVHLDICSAGYHSKTCLAGSQLISICVNAVETLVIGVVMLQITVLYTRLAVPSQDHEPTIKWQPQ